MLLALARVMERRAGELGVSVPSYAASADCADLALLAVGWATLTVSPFNPMRDDDIAALRREIADETVRLVVDSPATAAWHEPLATDRQVWVGDRPPTSPTPSALRPQWEPFPALATKPLGGLWTSTELPGVVSAWMTDEPMDWGAPTGPPWRARISRPVRCYEIGSRKEWVDLCERFPSDTTSHYALRLDNSLLDWSPPFIAPDWAAVQEVYDAVHLTWWGYIDASYEVVPLLGGTGTTCLAGWGSEATLWFRWLFDGWTPIDLPNRP